MQILRRQIPQLVAALTLITLLGACSKGVDWSARERENAAHLQASLQATSEAARIANAITSESDFQAHKGRLLQTLRAAHLHAATVDDSVLDKLHPQLYGKFRLDYQRALARMINAYETGNLDAAQDAAGDIQAFINWYRERRHTFRWWEDAMQG
ncbi:MAG: hypothetical protein KY410_04785 [Proteobacteria bacterium]|nr:hypothetical protein [Pseudomonadota bacterium]